MATLTNPSPCPRHRIIYQLHGVYLGTSIPIKYPRFPINEHQFLSPDAGLICKLPAGSKMA